MNIKRQYPEAVLIMLLPPSYRVLEARLRGRATETEEVIRRRMARAREELEFLPRYDYVVYNEENGADRAAGGDPRHRHRRKARHPPDPRRKRTFLPFIKHSPSRNPIHPLIESF